MRKINYISYGKNKLGFKPTPGKEEEFGKAVERYCNIKGMTHGICFTDASKEECDKAYKEVNDAFEAIKEYCVSWRGKNKK